jgi:hypothetical protein
MCTALTIYQDHIARLKHEVGEYTDKLSAAQAECAALREALEEFNGIMFMHPEQWSQSPVIKPDALIAYVKAADYCRELFRRPFATVGECSTAADTFDSARAALTRALEGK